MAEPLSEAEVAELKQALTDRERQLVEALQASGAEARPVEPDSAIGRLSRMDAMQHQQLARARRARLEQEAAQVRAALGRIARGEYGLCVRCEEPIGVARLRARPEGLFCRACQAGQP